MHSTTLVSLRSFRVVAVAFAVVLCVGSEGADLWELVRSQRDNLRVATLFTAGNVRDFLSTEKGRAQAADWCRKTGVTHVFIETYRSGYQAEKRTLAAARDYFKRLGFEVSGCVTTTRIGKISTGWKLISCYTDPGTRRKLAEIFAFTAGLFDTIMIDDFFFTDCSCKSCVKARGKRSWAAYRCDLMCDVAKRDVLGAARRVNPKVKIILKYPQWYDNFHNRGYEVVRETKLFDLIWVGTETRDPDSVRWGRKAQYEAYFIMRWLSRIGGPKTGGGWFDPYGTSPPTYVEQARQTVLAGAREMLLFCYGSLRQKEHARNVPHLRRELPQLFVLRKWIGEGGVRGIPAVKPPNSQPAPGESYLFDWIGMLGLPLDPRPDLPDRAGALLVTSHLRSKSNWRRAVRSYLERGAPVLASKAVLKEVQALSRAPGAAKGAVVPLTWKGDVRSIMDIPQQELDRMRKVLLKPLGLAFRAPGRVGLYLPAPDVVAIENFRDEPAEFELADRVASLRPRERLVFPPGAQVEVRFQGGALSGKLPARTLLVIRRAKRK